MHAQGFQILFLRFNKHHVGETLDRQTLNAADAIGQLLCPLMIVGKARDIIVERIPAIAKAIAGKSPLAVRGSKEMLLYSRDHSVAEGLNYIATWNSGMMSQADLQAGMQAQMEKTQAVYED